MFVFLSQERLSISCPQTQSFLLRTISKIYLLKFHHDQSTVSRKRESMKLFETSKSLYGGEKDSDVEKLLRERSTIAASMRNINDVIRYNIRTMLSVLYCAVLCCAMLCCAVLCCGVLCCAVLWCAVVCCAVLWRAVIYFFVAFSYYF